jgi:hypothetical protein
MSDAVVAEKATIHMPHHGAWPMLQLGAGMVIVASGAQAFAANLPFVFPALLHMSVV